jgi:hypothetical protein
MGHDTDAHVEGGKEAGELTPNVQDAKPQEDPFLAALDPEPEGRTLDGVETTGRRVFLRRTVGAAATALGGATVAGMLARRGDSAPSFRQDVAILNFLLQLEYLQAAFYAEARDRAALGGELARVATTLAAHEHAHVAFLRRTLGPAARPARKFDFGNATADGKEFLAAAVTIEEAGIAAYVGQAGNLTKDLITDAARITGVEARHAAWVRDLARRNPAPRAQDAAKTGQQITQMIGRFLA